MDLLSYKVVALILEPHRNAVARGNNAKSIEMPLQEPAVDQNADNDEFDQPIDFELGENDQPLGENDQPPEEFQTEDEEPIDADPLIASPRRSAPKCSISYHGSQN